MFICLENKVKQYYSHYKKYFVIFKNISIFVHMRQFNFFRGNVGGARVVSIGGALNELDEPLRPEGMSNRHWNILPQDLRGGEQEDMILYIEGWESARININLNPYMDNENREMWNRGYMDCFNRRTRVYTERDMEYYHTEEFLFFDVSEVRYDIITGEPYKVILFRHIEDGNTVEGQRINPNHYMYNFPDII
jgi:hypothetical protein